MGTSLNGLNPASTYQALIKVGNNTNINTTLKTLSDGAGNDLPMQASTTAINFTGTVSGVASGVSGAIQFSNGSAFASDASNLFWDDTNNRLGVGTNSPTYKFMVSDNSANDGPVFFEKDLLNAQSDCYVYNKNASTNLTTGQIAGTVSFGGYFNSNYNPQAQEFASIQSYYKGNGTNRLGELQLRTHDGSGLQAGMIINENQLIGIGQNSPLARLHIVGKGSTSATTSLFVQNSSGTEIASFRDDLRVSVRSEFRVLDSVGNNAMIMYGDGYGGTRTLWVNGDLGVGVLGNNASARLQVDSTTQGFLPPRMTTTEKNAISSPAEGLEMYDSTAKSPAYYDGTNWGYTGGALQNAAGNSGTLNISFAAGNIVNLTLNANTTLAFSNAVIGTYIIQVTQGATGANVLTYPASVKWAGGTAPTLTTTVGKTDILTFYYDGTNYYGNYSLNY